MPDANDGWAAAKAGQDRSGASKIQMSARRFDISEIVFESLALDFSEISDRAVDQMIAWRQERDPLSIATDG